MELQELLSNFSAFQRHQILRLSRRKTHMLNPHHIYETSFTVRGATAVPFQRHQILRLSRIKTHMLNPHHIWNVIYSARSKRCHDPTSPNTAPATQKDSHASSSSHMKRHLQCAEQQASPSNITKYTAPAGQNCIAKFLRKSLRTDDNVISNAGPIRAWSDYDPSTIRPWSEHETDGPQPASQPSLFSSSPRAFLIVKYNVSRPTLHSNLHQVLHATKSDTIPNTTPATKSDNFTKYCACHEKWH